MQDLQHHQQRLAGVPFRQLFADDSKRAERFSVTAAGLQLNYARNPIDDAALTALLDFAKARQAPEAIASLFAENQLNNTEQRAVQHPVLRGPAPTTELQAEVDAAKAKMAEMVDQILSGRWVGGTGLSITDVVNIGVGGSDHGPAMVCHALRHLSLNAVRCHFVSNMDGDHIQHVLRHCKPAQTLFVIVSKSFSTLETRVNTEKALAWLHTYNQDPQATAKHLIAVTAHADKAQAVGIVSDNILPIWSWVGGRYSLWSGVGLCVALQIGWAGFEALLAGAAAMDAHFQQTPLAENMPVLLALLGVWYRNLMHAETQAIIPYSDALSLLPVYLQQLHMESLGKRVDTQGQLLSYPSGPVVWGGAGSVSQHTFHQFLLQSETLVPVDFILPLTSHGGDAADDARVVANCLSQACLLMHGLSLDDSVADLEQQGLSAEEVARLAPHKVLVGNQPSNLITMLKVTPENLGALIALYEHKVFVQSVLWQINAFDQWGVERGKQCADEIFQALCQQQVPEDLDQATQQAMRMLIEVDNNGQH